MTKLLLFTDLHLGHETPPEPLEQFKAALTHALAAHGDAVHVVIMGDLTHSGQVVEYQQLKSALADVPMPVTLMMGNHDARDGFLKVFPDAPTAGSGHVQSVVDMGDLRLITLDTLDQKPLSERHNAGILCIDRLNWLSDRLSEAPNRATILFAHHPPFATGLPGMDAIGLQNGGDLLGLLAHHPQVRHIFCGHQHRTVSGTARGLGFSILSSTWRQLELNMDGPKNRFSDSTPGVYGVVLASGDSVVLHSEAFGT
jgi:3',5'-cyclic-AMP phosphodiesterase